MRNLFGLKRLRLNADRAFLVDRALRERLQKERQLVVSKIVELCPRNAKILDIGCGGGSLLQSIGPTYELYGIDVSISLIRFAKKHTNACFIVGSANKLPFRRGTFDVVVMYNLLHHLTNVKWAINDITRTLKTTGYFIILERGVSSKITSVFAYIYTKILEKFTGEPWTVRFLTPKDFRLLFPHIEKMQVAEYFSKTFFYFKFVRMFLVGMK